jgi:hypothetical protein
MVIFEELPKKAEFLKDFIHSKVGMNLYQYFFMFDSLYYLRLHFEANYRHFKENYLHGSIPNKKLGLYGYYMQWCANRLLRFH